MGAVLVTANYAGAGKTSLIAALLVELLTQDKKAAYYKPFSSTPDYDPDVTFVSQTLTPGGRWPEIPSPQALPAVNASGASLEDELARQIGNSVSSLASQAATILLEGPDLNDVNRQSSPLDVKLASVVNAKVVLLAQYRKDINIDDLTAQAKTLGDRLVGLVLNSCPIHRHREVTQSLLQPMRERGLPVWGAIPEDRLMLAVTVQQIADGLGGSWVQEPVDTTTLIDRFLIGGNIMDSGPNYFGRYQNQAVITRAERPDIQLASLMCDTRCLVLTGGGQPSEYVRVEADKKRVPLISVTEGTIPTAEALAGLLEQANAHSQAKAARLAELMHRHLDMEAVSSAVG